MSDDEKSKRLYKIAAISVRIRNAMELSCITNSDFPTEVMDAECDSICHAVSPEMAELIREKLYLRLREEVPYTTHVEVETIEKRKDGTVYVKIHTGMSGYVEVCELLGLPDPY